MTPRKKSNVTSSESTTSSNSSSSSSSSSSTSGTESSSSDSENSSTSQASAAKSGHGSTDSDSRNKLPKKKTVAAKTKSNTTNTSNETDTAKSKDKAQLPNKSRPPKSNPVYSSESEESQAKPNTKRKPPAKPKASATVTPITKQTKQTSKSNSATGPKQSAVKDSGNSTSGANKKPSAADKDATPKASAASNKQQSDANAQKKLKTKSIFSPENSSESDDQTIPPPKLSPMKNTATKSSNAPKPKAKATVKPEVVPTPPSKSGASSASSTSASSGSSDSSSDTDSSADSSATTKQTHKKTAAIKKSAVPPGVRSRVETPPQTKAPSSAVESGPLSESDGEGSKNAVITRKLTRSSSARRSKHLVGKTSDTESESESKTSASAASKSPVKKAAGPKGPCPRKSKGRGGTANSDTSQTPAVEERHCPLDGCDSMGHLGGRAEKHFTIEACPKYHNKTAQECKDLYLERRKREEERRKAVALLSKKSPKSHHLTIEQRHYQMKIKELRAKSERRSNNNNSDPETDSSAPEEKDREREPRLTNITSEYDLKLFQEALAVASEKIEDDLKCLPHVKGTKYIEIGKYEVEVWYQSPYPEDYARVPKLYLCEYCLRYMKSRTILKRHIVKCVWRHPPGEEVYRKEKISVWEVDGKRYKQYCQNLCLLAKFFLDHKTLYYDVEPFLFYVMTIGDSEGCHTVGYFSKEKNSFLNYNVSCILTLPPYQRQGYGRLLIDFSYLLTRVEGKVGSPEKPLSDLGLISYRSYWKDVLLQYLCNFGGKELSVKDISQEMAINSYDIVSTLQALGMMKYWKGKHIILKKQDVIDEYVERMKRRGPMYKAIDPTHLKWTPFVAPAATGPT